MEGFRGRPAWKAARLLSAAGTDNAALALGQPCVLRNVIGHNINAAARY